MKTRRNFSETHWCIAKHLWGSGQTSSRITSWRRWAILSYWAIRTWKIWKKHRCHLREGALRYQQRLKEQKFLRRMRLGQRNSFLQSEGFGNPVAKQRKQEVNDTWSLNHLKAIPKFEFDWIDITASTNSQKISLEKHTYQFAYRSKKMNEWINK